MSIPMKSATFRDLVSPVLEILCSGDEEFIAKWKAERDAAEAKWIAEKYPNGIPTLTAEEEGMMSGNARSYIGNRRER